MPNPRKPRPARVRIASDAFSVKISGSVRVAFLKMCRPMMRMLEAPTTLADSTYGSAFSRMVSARMTRKYCGTNTTEMEMEQATMPPQKLDWPWLMTIDITMARSSDGKA